MRRRGRPRQPILKPAELLELLTQGVQQSEIARMYGVSPAAVSQAMRALPKTALLELVTRRMASAPARIEGPREGPGVDVMGVVVRVHEKLDRLGDFLESDEAARRLKLGLRLKLQLTTLERTLKWAQTFLETNRTLLDLMGVDVWMQELAAVLADVDPALRDRLMERIRARGLVGTLPR